MSIPDRMGVSRYVPLEVPMVVLATITIRWFFLWGGKTCCALIATPKCRYNANKRQKEGKS